MLNQVIRAAKLGGDEINNYFGKTTEVFAKSSIADFRTEADLASEKAILEELQKHFPNFNYFAEESGWIRNGSEFTFIIDPLDGTNNFSLGVHYFSVSIGLQKGNETMLGVVYNPVMDQIYFAEKGKGAFLNDKIIKTNEVDDIKNASISYTCGYADDGKAYEELVKGINQFEVKRLLTNWSPALDYGLLASGRIESVICNGNDVYDNTAGKLIVKEAGGLITDLSGNDEKNDLNTYFVASNNKALHKTILDMCQLVSSLGVRSGLRIF